jgi:C_GCAxxG_C_C family probable redox protein
MLVRQNTDSEQIEELIQELKERSRNLYLSHRLLCSEAILVALNRGLNGGLSEDQALSMAAPFAIAMGESGCLCGALSGAVLACGLFLGNNRPYRHRWEMRECARELHDEFKNVNGATCCRVLSRRVKDDKKAHFKQCADLTAETTGMAARLILQKRPELSLQANKEFLVKRNSVIGSALFRLFHSFPWKRRFR